MIRFELGDLRITVLDTGSLWLDGGAMFGVVPKTLWAKERVPDDRNRIRLALNVLLVEDGHQRILIDSGVGTKWDDKCIDIYGIEAMDPVSFLSPTGLTPADIDLVVNTHLHFDHAGGNTVRRPDGTIDAAFPNAVHVVQRGELDFARAANERTRASYVADNFEPLAAEGRFRLLEGDTVLTRDLHLRVAPGHTPFMMVPVLVTRERPLGFLADLVPTTSHVPYPYIMGYDLDPLRTLATKKSILPEAVREKWLVVFEHDGDTPVGTLAERNGTLHAQPFGREA